MGLFRGFWIVVLGVLTFIAAVVWIVINPPGPRPPDISFLASDAHFSVAGQHLVVPVVALDGPDHVFNLGAPRTRSLADQIRQEARDPATPKQMDRINLFIGEYKYTGEHLASVGICPRLTRKWSQTLCRGEHKGMLRRLPKQFALFDHSKLDLLKNSSTVGRERRYDQVKDAISADQVGMGCDLHSKFCTAVIQALPGLIAVWTVWSDDQTGATAWQMANRQGPAIVQFVQHAIGPVEDPTLLEAE